MNEICSDDLLVIDESFNASRRNNFKIHMYIYIRVNTYTIQYLLSNTKLIYLTCIKLKNIYVNNDLF